MFCHNYLLSRAISSNSFNTASEAATKKKAKADFIVNIQTAASIIASTSPTYPEPLSKPKLSPSPQP